MNEGASKLFAEGFLKGFFGTVGLMLSNTPEFTVDQVDDLSPDAWPDLVSRFSASLDSEVASGGGIAMLVPAADVNGIASLFEERDLDTSGAIDEGQLETLNEIFGNCLGGGVAYFKEAYEQVIELAGPSVRPFTIESMEPVTELLGDDVIVASFSYQCGEAIDSRGVLLFSLNLESTIPEDQASAAVGEAPGAGSEAPTLDQAELDSILGDFGKQGQEDEAAKAPVEAAPPSRERARISDAAGPAPSNLDMILDIRLEATARLGRVEMPLNDILNLGPGSIIEVGHLVDEPIELLVNNKLIARGDVVVVDEKFGLRITEIATPQERIESLR